jgi:uncharacterized protein
MEQKLNSVSWFDLPVTNMDRAVKFYETILGIKIERLPMGPMELGIFPHEQSGIGSGGALVYNPDHYKVTTDGVLIYFNSQSGDLANELGRVEASGGKILRPKSLIAEDIGYMAVFLDSEGNKVALHSKK